MNRTFQNNTHLEELRYQLWKIVDFLRHEALEQGDYYVVLYFISLLKNGSLRSFFDKKEQDFKRQIQYRIRDFSDNYSDVNNELYNVFQSTIDRMSEKTIDELLWLLRGLDTNVFHDNYQIIFDDLLYKLSAAEGRKGGEFMQPKGLTRFINKIIELQSANRIYNPFAGVGSFGIELKDDQYYYGQELNKKTWAIGALRMMAHGNLNHVFKNENSISKWNPEYRNFDLIVSHPPFGLKIKDLDPSRFGKLASAEDFLILNALENLSSSGRIISIVPLSFIQKSTRTNVNLRKHLIDRNLLEMVITFSGGLLSHTGISFAIIVINKNKPIGNKVRFIDTTKFLEETSSRHKQLNYDKLILELKTGFNSQVTKFVSNDDIEAENYNLNVHRYFLPKINGIKFSEFSEFIQTSSIARYASEQLDQALNEELPFIRIRDLKDENFDYFIKTEDIEYSRVPRSARAIEESCLLLSLRWRTLKPTYFEYQGTPVFLSSDIVPLRIDRSKIDITYLVNELYADYIEEQLKAYRVGAVMPFIKKNDLMNVVVQVPDIYFQDKFNESLKAQEAKVEGIIEISNKLKRLQEERNALAHSINVKEYDEFASLKHSLGTPRQNILSSAEVLLSFLKDNAKDFDLINEKYNEFTGENIEDALSSIKSNVNYMSELLEKGENGLVLENYPLENVPITELQKIIRDVSIARLNFKLKFELIKSEDKKKLGILCNKTLFKVLIEEVFNNAHKYGFESKKTKNIVVVDLSVVVDETIGNKFVVDIRNNGLPFPDNFAKSNFIAKYSTSDIENGGTGIGGYDIDRIATYFNNNNWELILNEDRIYPVRFKFEFPIILNQ
jgi:type I restriction enzyme M protein